MLYLEYLGKQYEKRCSIMEREELFWSAPVDALKKGYIYDESAGTYTCLLCGYSLEAGLIHEHAGLMMTSKKRMTYHIEEQHGGVFHYLLQLNKKFTGLTDNQKEVLACFYDNKSDKETAQWLSLTDSTIRNYRFKLREKEKQARVILTLMELLQEQSKKERLYMDPHPTATMVDDRYAITQEENDKIIKRYFTAEGELKDFPAKEKRKLILLREISKHFKPNVQYKEYEINRILKRIYHDHVLLRRYLIEYGFLDRKNDCSSYWVK